MISPGHSNGEDHRSVQHAGSPVGAAWSAVTFSPAALTHYVHSRADARQVVHVYLIDLDTLACERGRREASRAAFRQVLGAHLGQAGQDVPLERDANGRPRLAAAAAGLKVSSSRSGRHAVFALCTGHEIGIDIESTEAARFDDEVAETMLSRAEQATYAKVVAGDRERWLAEAWAAKEAILKGMGLGLGVPPALVEPALTPTLSANEPARWRSATVPDSWSVASLPWQQHVIAVSKQGGGLQLRCAQLLVHGTKS